MAKPRQVREVMTPDPVLLEAGNTAADAAQAMKRANIGAVLVRENGKLRGILTDRDLVVRCLAEADGDARTRKLAQLCSADLVTIGPEAPIDEAIDFMKRRAVRRIPVVDGDAPVGILSLGDLAQARDPNSALGQISGASPNR